MSTTTTSAFTRRTFLGLVGAGAAVAGLAACSSGGAGGAGASGKPLKFWNMPDGGPAFLKLDKQIVAAYKPADGLPKVTYQQIPWAGFAQVFSSAIASHTGPAVSGGGGTQAFQFAHQGAIAYADHLLESWKSNGLYDDFLPGVLETMKTDQGYVAVPYNLDCRVSWYNKTLMAKAGADNPTTWDEYKDVCAKLKKIGVYGFGLGAGAGNYTGGQVLTAFMINNGGGLFNAKQEPDCLTDANVEAIEYVLELVKNGYSDPAGPSYTSANVQSQWKAGKFGFGWDTAGLAVSVGGDVANDMVVGDPLTSSSGKKGGLYFPNNLMMYKNTPSQKGSEAFLTYYYKRMSPLWTHNTGIGLPVLKSIAATPQFKQDANNVKVLNTWQPIYGTWAAPGGKGLFYNVANTVDGTQPMVTFAQSILGGKTDAKSALTTLQNAIEGLMK